jgi:hypothetical protein
VLDEASYVDQDQAEREQRCQSAFGVIVHTQSLEPQPLDSAFDAHAEFAESGTAVDAVAGDTHFDPAPNADSWGSARSRKPYQRAAWRPTLRIPAAARDACGPPGWSPARTQPACRRKSGYR